MGSFLSCAVSTSILSGPLGQRTAIRSAERKGPISSWTVMHVLQSLSLRRHSPLKFTSIHINQMISWMALSTTLHNSCCSSPWKCCSLKIPSPSLNLIISFHCANPIKSPLRISHGFFKSRQQHFTEILNLIRGGVGVLCSHSTIHLCIHWLGVSHEWRKAFGPVPLCLPSLFHQISSLSFCRFSWNLYQNPWSLDNNKQNLQDCQACYW